MRKIGLAIALLTVLSAVSLASGQVVRPIGDERIVKESQKVAIGEHVEIYQHKMKVDPAFLKLAEDAYRHIEELIEVKFDRATLGPKVRIYVFDFPFVSHVWNSSNHPKDPKGVIFLNRNSYLGALKGVNVTYVHEMVHLFMWRYHSHTLREGLAEYIALKVLPAGIATSPVNDKGSAMIPTDVMECLGTTKRFPSSLTTDPAKRRVYYLASHRLVKYLIETKDLETFKKLYESGSPETEIHRLYGISREEAIRAAGM